ncbi:MAG: hypothetical protein QXU32_09440 [Nitrososphaerales archaeon]
MALYIQLNAFYRKMKTNLRLRLMNRKGYSAIALAAVLIGAFMFVSPTRAASGQVSESAFQALDNCYFAGEIGGLGFIFDILLLLPEDFVEMNTVVITKGTTPVAKTVHVEKEVYFCHLDQGNVPVIVEQDIYLEIFQNMNTKQVLRKQAEVITCVKKIDNAEVIGCDRKGIPTDPVVVQGCFPVDWTIFLIDFIGGLILHDFNYDQVVRHPMETNTVVNPSNTRIAKTVNAQKEVFICDFGNGPFSTGEINPNEVNSLEDLSTLDAHDFEALKKVDLVIFQEIWQDGDKLPNNPITKRSVIAVKCVTNLLSDTDNDDGFVPEVESCKFTNVTL